MAQDQRHTNDVGYVHPMIGAWKTSDAHKIQGCREKKKGEKEKPKRSETLRWKRFQFGGWLSRKGLREKR